MSGTATGTSGGVATGHARDPRRAIDDVISLRTSGLELKVALKDEFLRLNEVSGNVSPPVAVSAANMCISVRHLLRQPG